jgi:hypothetical protein
MPDAWRQQIKTGGENDSGARELPEFDDFNYIAQVARVMRHR